MAKAMAMAKNAIVERSAGPQPERVHQLPPIFAIAIAFAMSFLFQGS